MRIGLALAGGGASGGAHVGVIRALEDAGLHIDAIGGTSSGAMVAGLFAAGLSTSDLTQLLPTLTRKHIDVDPGLLTRWINKKYKGGLVRGDRLHTFIKQSVKDRAICDVTTPLVIVATDLQTGQEVVLSSSECNAPIVSFFADSERDVPLWRLVTDIPLATAIRASIGIPFVFQPVLFRDMILVDGGLVDNCPVLPLRALGADFVIASDTITPFLRLKSVLPLRLRSMLQQIVNIGLARHAALSALQADVFLAPPVGPIGALDFPRLSTVAERGYAYTKQRIPELLTALEIRQKEIDHLTTAFC